MARVCLRECELKEVDVICLEKGSSMQSDSDSDNFDDWSDGDDVSCRSLFDSSVLDSPRAVVDQAWRDYRFGVRDVCRVIGTDDITLIKLVNFVRGRVQEAISSDVKVNVDFATALQEELCTCHETLLSDDKYMLPVDREDPLLYLLSEAMQDDSVNIDDEDDPQGADAQQQVIHLKEELAKCKALLKELTQEPSQSLKEAAVSTSSKGSGKAKEDKHGDNYYFDGYGHLSIHEVMLRDRPRTTTYQASLMKNMAFIKDKVVLDVGCGTGILSMFAAQAGARRVIGVDSSNIIESAKQIVARNGFSSDKVTLIKGRLEEIELPPGVEGVDVIISEWMGYALYFENMLTSVLYARDKWLNKSTGLLLPNTANIFIEAMAATEIDDRVGYWKNVYGFDMSLLDEGVVKEAQVQYVEGKHVASNRCETHVLEISTATNDDLDFVRDFKLVVTRDAAINCFVVSFDVTFNGLQMNGEMASGFKELVLSTGCEAQPTHWKQTVLWLKAEHIMQCEAGTELNGKIHYQRSPENPRDYLLALTWSFEGRDYAQSFSLEA